MDPNQYNPQPGIPPQGYPPQQGPYSQQPMPGSGPYPLQQNPYGPPQQPYAAGPPMQPGMPPQGPIQQIQSPMMGYNPYPYPGEFDTPKSGGPNKIILGVIAVVVIAGVLFAVLATNGGSGNNNNQNGTNQNQTNQTQNSSDSTKDVIARSDGKLDLSSKIKTSQTLKQQTVQGNMNEQVNLSSGFSYMVTKVENYTSPNKDTLPGEGKRFIAATVVVGNRADSSNLSVSYLDFRLRDSDDLLIAGHATTNEILNNPLSSPGELKPGEQITGKIVFEVAQNDTSWVLKHSETYQKTTDNTTFNVEGEIVIKIAKTSTGSTDQSTPEDPSSGGTGSTQNDTTQTQ